MKETTIKNFRYGTRLKISVISYSPKYLLFSFGNISPAYFNFGSCEMPKILLMDQTDEILLLEFLTESNGIESLRLNDLNMRLNIVGN